MSAVESKRDWRSFMRERVESGNSLGGDRRNIYRWNIYNSRIDSYQGSFSVVLEGTRISSWVQSKSPLTIVDFMSSTEAIASIFEYAFQDKQFGLAVSLEDVRSDLQKERDKRLNIEQLNGDLILPSTWKRIGNQLKGRKADLIMEKASGGLENLPRDTIFYGFIISKMWEMLNQNGMILLEMPHVSSRNPVPIDVLEWVRLMKGNNFGVVFNYDGYVLKLIKTSNSPEKLPFLK